MIKHILLALDGSDHARTALQYGLWLAERFQAELSGLHVIDIVSVEGPFFQDISGALGFEPYLDVTGKVRQALHERGQQLIDEFTITCRERRIPCESQLVTGVIANEICDHARTSDLVVIGHRGANERFSTGLLGGTAESVTRKSPRPVFITPKQFQPITNPLLAYDGSPRASTAMHLAAEFCVALQLPLTVLSVAPREKTGDGKLLEEARHYLNSYGISLTLLHAIGHANQQIIETIKERSHNLLFIGAYGHSRIIEMVLGSTTEYVLRNAPCPVFLSR
ncbi:MAG: universal stress protein [Deltaproteobacteria bacterium]|nr:universal stress protein [Deltaproteobacteria bacterium]